MPRREPQIVKKNQKRFDGLDEKIISLYARGMTTREIQGHLEEIYGVEVGVFRPNPAAVIWKMPETAMLRPLGQVRFPMTEITKSPLPGLAEMPLINYR